MQHIQVSAGRSREFPNANAGFIFDHIPKTAGSALRVVFEEIFGPANVSPHLNIGKTERWAEKHFSQYRMIFGHFHYPLPRAGLSEERLRVTMLRDPIDRAVSEYFYFRNDVNNAPWDHLVRYAKDHDLLAYVKLLEAAGDIAVSNRYAHHFAAQVARPPWSKRKLLSAAMEAIAKYEFVGIQEQFVDSADVFCATYKLPLHTKLPRANTTSDRVSLRDLDVKTRASLIRLNDVDIEIYERVRANFQDRKRRIFEAFAVPTSLREPCLPVNIEETDAGQIPDGTVADDESFGDKAVEICGARVLALDGPGKPVRGGQIAYVRLLVAAHADIPDLVVGIQLSDEVGDLVFGTNSHLSGLAIPVQAGKKYMITFAIKADIRHGRYGITAAAHAGGSHPDRCFHWCDRITSFEVIDGDRGVQAGYCRLETSMEYAEAPTDEAWR